MEIPIATVVKSPPDPADLEAHVTSHVVFEAAPPLQGNRRTLRFVLVVVIICVLAAVCAGVFFAVVNGGNSGVKEGRKEETMGADEGHDQGHAKGHGGGHGTGKDDSEKDRWACEVPGHETTWFRFAWVGALLELEQAV
jgi:hypothetical protein